MKIDNFALTMHQTCPAKYDLRINNDWSVRRRSAALGFGGALHEGLAAWYKTHDQEASLNAIEVAWPQETPFDDYRSKSKCLEVMRGYIKQYPSESFQIVGFGGPSPMVEVSFTLETGMFLSCLECRVDQPRVDDFNNTYCSKCGDILEPIEWGGIFDTLIDFSGQIYILEHKSTSQLGPFYFQQFKPNNQISGYVWAAQKLTGRRVGGAIVNAIGVYKSQATKYVRDITTRNEADLATWMKDVKSTCEEIRAHQRDGYFPRRTTACQLYGQCEYHSVHVLSTATEQLKRLENDYIKEPWDFERRDEVAGTSGS